MGELHPAVAASWDLEGGAAFELDFDALATLAPDVASFRDLTSFPAVRQDLAVIVPARQDASTVSATVDVAGGSLLASVSVFDVYELSEDEKSIALSLEFRAADRTLTDDEVAQLRAHIVAEVADKLGGRLRA